MSRMLLAPDAALEALSKRSLEESPRLHRLKTGYLDIIERRNGKGVEVCVERALLITKSMRAPENARDPMVIRRAKAINDYLSNREIHFHDDNLLAGATTSKEMGAPVYPEFLGMSIWPELDQISTRTSNPQKLSAEDAMTLNLEVFPYWMDKTVLERTRTRLTQESSDTLLALDLMERVSFFINGGGAVISHTVPYFQDVLKHGLLKMIDEATRMEHAASGAVSPDAAAKAHFYRAMQISMHGILAYANNLRDKADRLGLETMRDVLTQVPAHPATSFHQAVNALWLCHVAILAENVNMAMSPGRLDQILYPYYCMDAEKCTTHESKQQLIDRALELIGCLWFKIADNTNLVPESAEKMFGGAGSVPAVTVGGIDRQEEDAVNDLTYLMLKATQMLSIRDPNVNARLHLDKNPPEYQEWIAQTILKTRAIPAVYNDEVVIASLVGQKIKLEDARDYAIVGCVEPTTSGQSFAETSAILLNLTAAMDMTLNEGNRPPLELEGHNPINPHFISLEGIDTFEEFLAAFRLQLEFLVDQSVSLANALGESHRDWLPSPLLSCFFCGPMTHGKDLTDGGATYNSSGATHVGFADVCDSLNAIEWLATRYDEDEDRDENPFEVMRDAVAHDFEGYEELRQLILAQAPKFGSLSSNGHGNIAQRNAQWLITLLFDLYQHKDNARGGVYRPAFWTMTNHAGLGQVGRALPSGRKAKQVFSSGITPVSQSAKDLLAAYNAVGGLCRLDHEVGSVKYPIPGGIALNMKYTPFFHSLDNPHYVKGFRDLITGYFGAGGMQVQFTVQDYGTLLEAKEHPERFPDLIVRVSGYSAYFKDLNEAMQNELITRSQYDLFARKAVLLNQTKGESS